MSSINSIGGGGYSLMSPMKRQDPSQRTDAVFSKLDSSGKGFIEKSDLQSAFDKLSAKSGSGSTSDVSELFSKFDGNDDGKISKQEFSDTVKNMTAQLDEYFSTTRTRNAMQGGSSGEPGGEMRGMNGSVGRPPPRFGEGPTLSKDELRSTLNEVGTSDSRSKMMTKILNNFEKADTDSDGKVSFQEATAYDQSNPDATTQSNALVSRTNASAFGKQSLAGLSQQLEQQIRQLAQAYGAAGDPRANAQASLSITA